MAWSVLHHPEGGPSACSRRRSGSSPLTVEPAAGQQQHVAFRDLGDLLRDVRDELPELARLLDALLCDRQLHARRDLLPDEADRLERAVRPEREQRLVWRVPCVARDSS